MKTLSFAETQLVTGAGLIAAAISLPIAGVLTVGALIPGILSSEVVWYQSLKKGEGLWQSELNGLKQLSWVPYTGISLVKAAYNW